MNETAGLDLQQWVGRTDSARDRLDAGRVAMLAATLDDTAEYPEGAALPPGWHWILFAPVAPMRGLGPDGHPKRGGFLPPVALPRRMWAGGTLTFRRPLRVGEAVERHSTIESVEEKSGRSGNLVFVNVRHVVSGAGEAAIEEVHNIVYRDNPATGAPPPPATPAPSGAHWTREIVPDPVQLFRYSALTFNGHRIHYDQPYVTQVEGYPGLVVHGPLIATLLMELVRAELPAARLASLAYRGVSPLFDTAPFRVCGSHGGGTGVSLWAQNAEGALAMKAEAIIG